MSDNTMLIKPGTLFIFLIIGGLVFAMYTWADDTLERSKNQSLEDQRKAIQCSNVEVRFIDRQFNGTHTTIFVQVNHPVRALLVNFYSRDRNVSRVVNRPEQNSLLRVEAPVGTSSDVEALTAGCERVFNYR